MRTIIQGMTFFVGFALTIQSQAAILATVNESNIDSKDLQSEYSQLNDLQRERINKDSNTRKEIIEGAVNAELVLQAARKAGGEEDEEFKRATERFKKQYLATRYMQKNIEGKLTKDSMKEYYNKHKGSYDSSQIRAMHILVSSEADAQKLLGQAKSTKSEAEFMALAKKNSIDPTVQENGGDLGFFTRDRMVPEFAAAAFAMRKGEVKGPVRSIYGFHIIKVIDVKLGRVSNFEEVESRVKDDLRALLAREMISQLRSKASVKLNDDAVSSFKL